MVIFNPTWAPDGNSVAFTGMSRGLTDLWVLDLASGQLRQLTNDPFADLQPAWSPDVVADVSVTVAITGSPAVPGDPVTATFTVTNHSPQVTAHHVALTTTFTAGGAQVATSPPAGCNVDGSGCAFPALAAGESRQYAVTLTYPSPVTGQAAGTVASTTFDPDLSNNTAEVAFGGAAAAFGDTRVAAQREARAIPDPQAKVGDGKAQARAHQKARTRAHADGDGRKNWSRRHLLRRGWPLA